MTEQMSKQEVTARADEYSRYLLEFVVPVSPPDMMTRPLVERLRWLYTYYNITDVRESASNLLLNYLEQLRSKTYDN